MNPFDRLKLSPPQGLEVELRSIQAHSLQSEGYLVQLDDRLSSLSSSTGRNLTGLSAEVSRASTWLQDQDLLFRFPFITVKILSYKETSMFYGFRGLHLYLSLLFYLSGKPQER